MNLNKGKLYLIPTTLGEGDFKKVIPSYNIEIIKTIDEFIVEEIKTARRFLKKIGFYLNFNDITFHILNEHTDKIDISSYLDSISLGKDIGLMSEAGTPCVADPGAEIVKIAHKKNIKIVPLIGPSSILLSIMASGFNGQNFAFVGYLPIKILERKRKIRELEKLVYQKNQTQIFIEAPYRNNQLLETILKTCYDETLLCIACNLTLADEFISTKTIKQWRKQSPDIHKKTTIFLLYK